MKLDIEDTFKEEKRKFLNTLLPSILQNDIEVVDIDRRIQELKDSEDIEYEIISLTDFSVLPLMKDLAIKKLPPFESADGTDKGFKDAYIYFTILEYISNIPDKYVFVCVKDKRLKEAFEQHTNIIVVENYDEFKKRSVSRYKDDYFIEKINEKLELTITKEDIIDTWTNIDGNTNMLVNSDDDQYVVEIDAGEIINYDMRHEYSDFVDSLINSTGFNTTHSSIDELDACMNLLTNYEILRILEASVDNEQIRWIINDDDVREFIGTLYKAKGDLLDERFNMVLQEDFKNVIFY